MEFNDLNLGTPLANAINDLEFIQPTPIQYKAYPVIMSGRDVVGIAQTGTGKTFAYLMPILRMLKFSEQRSPRVLIVVPTRELVVQVKEEAEKLAKYMSHRIDGVYGGTNINTQKKMVYAGLDILVATPGRLIDLALTGVLRLNTIQKLVIDEVDEMLNQGFKPQIEQILEMLPAKRQNVLFSATLSKEVEGLIQENFKGPEKIEIAPHGTPLEQILQLAYELPNFTTKVNMLKHMFATEEELQKVLLFVSSRKIADLLHTSLENDIDTEIGVIHSNKSQNYRFRSVENFDKGESRLLIATDIASRGLDIENVSHVINFDLPDEPHDYLHRIGRTGRADKEGVAVTFFIPRDEEMRNGIEALMDKKITNQPLPEELSISNKVLDFEREIMLGVDVETRRTKLTQTQGAFHEKKAKNKKVNLGGPGRRNPKHGNKKRQKRSGERR